MQDIYRKIQQEYENNRNTALAEVEKKKKELYEKEPKILEIDENIKKIGMEITKSIIFMDDDSKRTDLVNELNLKVENLKTKKAELLKELGINDEYLTPNFTCKMCEDTGIIGSITGAKNCSCFRQKIINYTYNQSQIYNIDKENFDTFDENVFSNEVDEKRFNSSKSPRENVLMVKEIAKNFVDNFDKKDTKSLLFTGGTGLGKTFLSNCIAKAVLDNGKTVLYQTAGRLMDLVMDYRKGDIENFDEAEYNELFNVDLLIIDDLGTENMTEARRSELFNILNTRLLNASKKGTKTLISTNKDLKELVNYYDQRIVSRILGNFEICRFFGNDLRLQRK